jgi:hypothetical protein
MSIFFLDSDRALLKTLHYQMTTVHSQLINVSEQLDTIEGKVNKVIMTLDDVQAAVTAEDTVIDSAIALIQGLAAQVAALKPNQKAIDALAADIKAKSDSLAAAVAANTTPTPAPAPAPATEPGPAGVPAPGP